MDEPEHDEYFPVGVFHERPDSDDFVREWYSAHLRSMREPSLWQLGQATDAEFFRFLWIPTWLSPFAVRLETSADGTTSVYGRTTNGLGGYEAGTLTHDSTRVLTLEEYRQFKKRLEATVFWTLPAKKPVPLGACDGEQWIFEGVSRGRYHIVDRWSLRNSPLVDLALYLLSLSALPIPSERLQPRPREASDFKWMR